MTPPIILPAGDLADHPLLAHIPVWPATSAEFKSLRESLREDGQLYEVLIDSGNRVVDGRNRRNALLSINQPVACRRVSDSEVSTVILDSLLQRRHLCKSARAYLVVPVLEPALAEARTRRALNVTADSRLDRLSGKNVDELAATYGFSRDLIFQARRVRELLDKHPEHRDEVEQRILDGELSLGGACTALANFEHNATRAKRLNRRSEHHRLFLDEYLPKLGLHWTKATPAQREEIRGHIQEKLLAWPAELTAEFNRISRIVLRDQEKSA